MIRQPSRRVFWRFVFATLAALTLSASLGYWRHSRDLHVDLSLSRAWQALFLLLGVFFLTTVAGIVLSYLRSGDTVWDWLESLGQDSRAARGLAVALVFFFMGVMTVMIFIDPSLGFPVVVSLAALAGVGISSVHVLTWAMIPDAVEVDELESGARHEGMFYALATLFRKVASSIAIPLSLLALDMSGFVSNADVQPASAVWAIRILIGPVPSILLLGGILFARFYPLSREAHAETREHIAARKSPAD